MDAIASKFAQTESVEAQTDASDALTADKAADEAVLTAQKAIDAAIEAKNKAEAIPEPP